MKEQIRTIEDKNTGETYYLEKKNWDWVGEVRFFQRNMPWLKNICIRHGIAIAEQDEQRAILLAHRNHKFEFQEFVDFLQTFFPVVYKHNLTNRLS